MGRAMPDFVFIGLTVLFFAAVAAAVLALRRL